MKKIILLILMFIGLYSNAQTSCANSQPFCAGASAGINFPATVNGPPAQTGPDYGCLGSEPNPAWYYLQVSNSGNIVLGIAGTANQDVDFICWGPFTSATGNCNNLTAGNTIDCSYSASYTETCTISNAISGQFYLLLITNFSNQVQNITLTQVGGTGSTNCALLTANNSSICAGGTASIVATNAGSLTSASYSLNPGALTSPTPTFVVSPTTTTTYTVYITGTNASAVVVTQTAIAHVTVMPQPAVAPTTTQSSCTSTVNGFNLGLTFNPSSPTPNYTVAWSPIPFSVSSATQTTGSGGIAAGVYNATVTAAGGCSTTTSFSINPTPAPAAFNLVPNASSYTITCAQPTVVISANPSSYSYTWTNGVSAPQTGTTAYFTSANQGTWTVMGVDPVTGCSTSHSFVVSQNITTPTSTVSPLTQNITCNLASITTVTGTGTPSTNVTHVWTSPANVSYTTSTSPALFLPGGPGVYTHCIIDNVNGCSSCSNFSVTTTAGFPTFSVTSPQQFTLGCGTTSVATINIIGAQTTPTPGGTLSYTILGPPTTTNYTPGTSSTYTVNVPGTWTVITKDVTNSCETKVQVSVILNNAPPSLTATAVTPTLTCYHPKTILQGTSGTPNVSYSWLFPGTPGQTPNDTLTVYSTTAVASVTVATYTLSVTDNVNKCNSTQTLTIYQDIHPPIAGISPPGSLTISCAIPTVNLTNNSQTFTYSPNIYNHPLIVSADSWAGPSPQQPVQFNSTYQGGVPGVYTLTVKDLNNGCTAIATKTVIDNRVYPVVNTPVQPGPFILDCGAPGATIYPIVTGTTTGFTYSWVSVPTASFSSQITATTIVNQPGVYKIDVTNSANGCVGHGVVEVLSSSINADFNPSATTGYAPLSVSFNNLSASTSSTTGSSSITSVWSFGNGSSQITTSANISPSTIYTNAGTYTVTLYVKKGSCLDTVSKVIVVDLPSKLEVPNVFTPNGDGSNDVFFLKVANVSEINALIYDRWGNKVFETNSSTGNIEWDGKNMSGKDVAVGTYFYIIKGTGKDGTAYDKKGNVSVYR